jgi:hypothetical protein
MSLNEKRGKNKTQQVRKKCTCQLKWIEGEKNMKLKKNRRKRRKNKMTDFHRHDDGRQYAPLKRRSTSTRPHGATFQKAVMFILAAVRTWNLIAKKEQKMNLRDREPSWPGRCLLSTVLLDYCSHIGTLKLDRYSDVLRSNRILVIFILT